MIKYAFLFFFLNYSILAQTPFESGLKLFKEQKFTQAKPFFENAINQNQNKIESIEYLGDIAGHEKNWDEAIKQYKLLKIQFPKKVNYWYKYGGALGMKAKNSNKFKALGMINDVENAFLTAAKLDSQHIETRWALVILYLELPGIIGGSEKKSQKYANELFEISIVDGYLAKAYIDEYFKRYTLAEKNYLQAHKIGNSKTTFEKLYNLYLYKLKNKIKANQLKEEFKKN